MALKTYPDVVEQMISNRYAEGMTAKELGEKYKMNPNTITKIAKKWGAPIQSNSEKSRKYYKVDHTVFSEVNEKSAYWIGFLLADGCVRKSDESAKIFSVGLGLQDAGHLYKLREFLKSEHKISSYPTYCRYAIRSNELVDILEQYNITPNKTGKEKCPKILKYNKDFWRGVIDGDGCLTNVNSRFPTLSLCGSKSLCEDFRKFVLKSTIHPSKATVNKIKNRNCYTIQFRTKIAKDICSLLYSDAKIYLDRKKIKSEIIINTDYSLNA